jgi:hypothetical protein
LQLSFDLIAALPIPRSILARFFAAVLASSLANAPTVSRAFYRLYATLGAIVFSSDHSSADSLLDPRSFLRLRFCIAPRKCIDDPESFLLTVYTTLSYVPTSMLHLHFVSIQMFLKHRDI